MILDSKSLGKKLKLYRAKAGWSLEGCSEKIGISTRYLANIERGDKVPKLETFVLVLNTLAAPADDVLQDSLAVGYEAKSNYLLQRLEALDVNRRKQALDILDGVISFLKND